LSRALRAKDVQAATLRSSDFRQLVIALRIYPKSVIHEPGSAGKTMNHMWYRPRWTVTPR